MVTPGRAGRDAADITPMKRLGKPENIASLIAYLASDDAEFVTGAEFVADGGFTAQ
ncbi:MAG: SDR family oxidoreductase [Gulosibacter sp.]|uniref:SDR family oxidoreductase n=1 Tax=Gulosibacter sp. TaxID=2817531 RepID=UPI003F910075